MIASLARSLRGQVKNGTLSQGAADRELDEYKHLLQREPFAPGFRAFCSARKPAPASAAQPSRGKAYSDSVAENAIIGTITTGLFTKIPSEKLIPANAFTDEKCRIIYAAALSLRQAGATIVTARAVNEVLERSGAPKRLNKLLDAYDLSPESWKLWDHEIDRSLACAPTTLPVEDSLAHLKALYANREDLRIGERLSDGTLSGEQAIAALAALHQSDGRNGNSTVYAVRNSEEILSLQFSPDDILLSNGYLAAGDSTTFCGAPVGKSRLSNKPAICCALGLPFLGWQTTAMAAKWLFLQTENGNRRLQADLSPMLANLTSVQRQMVKEALAIHTLESEEDGIMFLSNERAVGGIRALIEKIKPDIVVFDPLRDFAISDLKTDGDMAATLAAISRITREGNPRRIPFVIHHALTGKAGIAKAVGIDRGSFGRNSKVLAGWTRAQINCAPYEPDNNEVLVISSGKANNAEEFEPFGIRLDTDAMTYRRDNSIDLEGWKERIGVGNTKGQKATIADVVKLVERVGLDGIAKPKLAKQVREEADVSRAYAYRLIEKAEAKKAVIRRKPDDLYVVPKPPQNELQN